MMQSAYIQKDYGKKLLYENYEKIRINLAGWTPCISNKHSFICYYLLSELSKINTKS